MIIETDSETLLPKSVKFLSRKTIVQHLILKIVEGLLVLLVLYEIDATIVQHLIQRFALQSQSALQSQIASALYHRPYHHQVHRLLLYLYQRMDLTPTTSSYEMRRPRQLLIDLKEAQPRRIAPIALMARLLRISWPS